MSNFSVCPRKWGKSNIRVLMIYYNKLSMDDYREIDIPNGAVYLLCNNNQIEKIERIL